MVKKLTDLYNYNTFTKEANDDFLVSDIEELLTEEKLRE